MSTILGGPLGKATVKAKSITDSEEESVAADKSFSSKDRSGAGGVGWESTRERDLLVKADLNLIHFLTPPPLPSPQPRVLPPPLHSGGGEGRSVHPHSQVRPVAVEYTQCDILTCFLYKTNGTTVFLKQRENLNSRCPFR